MSTQHTTITLTKSQTVHQWLTEVSKQYSFFDSFFLCSIHEGDIHVWPPSLTTYPDAREHANTPNLFSTHLSEPTFFRVCFQSCMPYHGYVVPSATHDALYKALDTTQPEHVTLLPILIQDAIVGILYMEKKVLDNPAAIPSISHIELTWDALHSQFQDFYQVSVQG